MLEDLVSPFGELGASISDSELRETAYEIFVAACRSSSGKPLTYMSQSDKASASSLSPSLHPSLSLQRSSPTSKVKRALGLKSSAKPKKLLSIGELMRVQMRISEQTDSRIRRALLRISAGQLGRRIEAVVLPLELLWQLKLSDFPTQQEYDAWQKRNLKILEAGLVLHPHFSIEKNKSSQKLQLAIQKALKTPIETGKNSESVRNLRSTVMTLACTSFDGSVSEIYHWADGFPLNLQLYQLLLDACFDSNDPTSIIEEVDEVLELVKKTWIILGMNQMLHNLCFSWALLWRYVETGQVGNDLLLASDNLFVDVARDANAANDLNYSKILSSISNSILGWAEKKLFSYHETFYDNNSMQPVLSLGVLSANILARNDSNVYYSSKGEVDVARDKIDSYIRSSMRGVYAQKLEKARKSSKKRQVFLPFLTSLAQEIREVAFNEKEIFSPILSKFHPFAVAVAAATLHGCYGNELKKFVSGVDELTPDVVHVLIAAEKLERDLVDIAVADSAESEDGGKGVIQEMLPYEAETVISSLVKSWIKTRVERMKEWVDRNLQQEAWDVQAIRERIAPSAVEVLRTIDETLEAFFLLPISIHTSLLQDLVNGLDKCVQYYILKAKSGCGTRSSFLPTIPTLTRCAMGSKFHSVFKKKEKSQITQRTSSTAKNCSNTSQTLQLCVRINTFQHIRKVLSTVEKKIISHLQNSGYHVEDFPNKSFDLSAASCLEGIHQLCQAAAYKIVFQDLSHVLYDSLYVGGVSCSTMEPFLQELDQKLEMLSTFVMDRARTRLITETMAACFDAFLLVLLGGGPSRVFALQDSTVIREDFRALTNLFWSNGDGLPEELIAKLETRARDVLRLFEMDTETLIERFKGAMIGEGDGLGKGRRALPATNGDWNSKDLDTLLRVLCCRCDEKAAKFVKRMYNLPKV